MEHIVRTFKALSSEVRLNVNLDVVLTVLANNCYRWLSRQLRGFSKAEPKKIFRKFVDTPGTIRITDNEIKVILERRSHNPVIAQAKLDGEQCQIPWLDNKILRIEFK